ncbi:hypothetical protein QCA50_004875 [Cerrena zonata]|uniref:DUF6533 domain-containing protein n=1 Tax=Cerrena zonata TaxID=2478898 RepID=A0AAW0GDM4_9APHY
MSIPGGVGLSQSIETIIRHGAAVRSMTLAGFTILAYDHILTFSQEVDLIWRASSFSFASAIFLFNRYTVPLMLIVDIYEFFGVADDSAMFCKVWTGLQSVLTVMSFMSIHAIAALRIHALHNGKVWVKHLLWIAGAIYFLSSASIIVTAQVQLLPNMQPFHHACVGQIPWFLWMVWLPSVIFESVLFTLTVCAMLDADRRRTLNTLSHILFRDGMLYFIVVSFCSLFSLLVWAFADPSLSGLARYFALAVVNIAGSRMVLNLKSYAASQSFSGLTSSWGNITPSTTVRFPATYVSAQRPDPIGTKSSRSYVDLVDLEMHAIERDNQQVGTRMMHQS